MENISVIDPRRSNNPLQDILRQIVPQIAGQLTAQAGTQVDIFCVGYIASTGQLEIVGTQPNDNAVKTFKVALANLEASNRSGLIIPG